MSRERGARHVRGVGARYKVLTTHLSAVCGQSTSLCRVKVQCGASAQSVPVFFSPLTNSGVGEKRFYPTITGAVRVHVPAASLYMSRALF